MQRPNEPMPSSVSVDASGKFSRGLNVSQETQPNLQQNPARQNRMRPNSKDRDPALYRFQDQDQYPLQLKRRQHRNQLATALGWISIGLGLAELLAPRKLAQGAGIDDARPGVVRALGVREIASGVGILSQPQPTPWLWSRVVGDAMDLALLGAASRRPASRRNQVAIAAAAVAGIAALDVWSSMQSSRNDADAGADADKRGTGSGSVAKSVIVNLSPSECYRYWRDFDNLPRFMPHLESVETVSSTRSRWRARGPAGKIVEWESELTADEPDQLLAWQSVPGSDVDHAGTVRFAPAPGGRGTLIWAEIQYRPPGGKAGNALARLFGAEPSQQIEDDLRHFRQLMETGEITTTVGQPSGARSSVARLLRKGAPG